MFTAAATFRPPAGANRNAVPKNPRRIHFGCTNLTEPAAAADDRGMIEKRAHGGVIALHFTYFFTSG